MTVTSAELGDERAIRTLVVDYARAADRRDEQTFADLFAVDAVHSLYDGDPEGREPTITRRGRSEIATIISRLARYGTTTHFIGQHSAVVDGDIATGETYCLAHHLYTNNGEQYIRVMSIRYLDVYSRSENRWYFKRRAVAIDWVEDRPARADPG